MGGVGRILGNGGDRELEWGLVIAQAWSRLADVPGLGRSKLKPGRFARDGSPVGEGGVSRMEAYPFADSDRDYLAERLGLPEGSESVRRTREHIAAVLEVYETALGVWGGDDEDGEGVFNGRISGLLRVAHAGAVACYLVAEFFGGWIEEEGRFRPEGEPSLWDNQPTEDDRWTLSDGPEVAAGSPGLIAVQPKRLRDLFVRWQGERSLAAAVASANGTIRDAIRRTTREIVRRAGEPARADDAEQNMKVPAAERFDAITAVHREVARGLLEDAGARFALARTLSGVRRQGPLSRFNTGGVDLEDAARAAELVKATLDARKSARAVWLLTSAWDLPPMRAEDGDTAEHTPENCCLLPWPHAAADCPEHAWSSRVVREAQKALDAASDSADLCIDLARFILSNPDRVDEVVPRLFGLSASALRGDWKDVPDWAWKPGEGVDTKTLAGRIASAADTCLAALTVVIDQPYTDAYSNECAEIGRLARSVVFDCGLVSEEVQQPPAAAGGESKATAPLTAGDESLRRELEQEDLGKAESEARYRRNAIIVARGGVVPGMAMSKAYRSVSRWAADRLNDVLAEAAAGAVAEAIGPAGVKAVTAPLRQKGRKSPALPAWSDLSALKWRFASGRVKTDPVAEVSAGTGMPKETVRAIVEDAKAKAADSLLSDPEVRAKVTEILRRTLRPLDTPAHTALALVAELCLNASQTQSGGSNHALALPPNVWLLWGAVQVAEAAGLSATENEAPLGKDTFARQVVEWIRGVQMLDRGHALKLLDPHVMAVRKALKSDLRPTRPVFVSAEHP